MEFASPTIATAWLVKAAPETVYAWLKAESEKLLESNPKYPKTFSPALLDALAGRNEQIVDLGLAQFGSSEQLLRRFWQTKEPAFQHAIAANQLGPPYLVFYSRDENGKMEKDPTTEREFAQSQDGELLRLYFANPRVGSGWLTSVFDRKDVYKELDDTQWLALVALALQNPNLHIPEKDDPFAVDGWAAMKEGQLFTSVYRLLLTAKPTAEAASAICDGLCKIGRFELPYDEFLEEGEAKVDVKSPEWRDWLKQRHAKLLDKILTRWVANPTDDPKSIFSDGKEYWGFGIIRQAVASKVPTFNTEMRKFLYDHKDSSVRAGYYQSQRYHRITELKRDFERDPQIFLEAAVENDSLYRSENAEVSDQLDVLISLAKSGVAHNRWEDLQFLSSRRHYKALGLYRQNPAIYLAPSRMRDAQPDSEVDPEASKELLEIRALDNRLNGIADKLGTTIGSAPSKDGSTRFLATRTAVIWGSLSVGVFLGWWLSH